MTSTLADYYVADPRAVLVPTEHLRPTGVSPAGAALLCQRAGWSPARVALLDAGFTRYWSRTAALAARTPTWAPPRRRHIAVIADPLAVHPYAQLLNTNAWMLYADDLDPERADAEWGAYLLAHADRAALLGEVSAAALHHAAWWFDRSEAECAAFAAAAARSTRPDADAFRALAGALGWLRGLKHQHLRPVAAAGHRAIPATGLLVPRAMEAEPPALVAHWAAAARAAVAAYHAAWRSTDPDAVAALVDYLAASPPPLLIVARGERVLWDPRAPERTGALRAELRRASGAAVRDLDGDLRLIERHSRRFLAALAEPNALPATASETEQRGYTFMHRQRRLLAINLDEPGIDRRHGPALPYARAMLGARAVHEWAHLAVDAGWVPRIDPAATTRHVDALAALLDAAVAGAPAPIRDATAADLAALVGSERVGSAGAALARVLTRRLPDFQANLLAQRFLDPIERETYVRQNVRPLRAEYAPPRRWRMLVRFLFEYQYLRFSAVPDRRAFFLSSTWCDADVIDSGMVDDAGFDALADAVAALCDGFAVDESKFRSLSD